MLTHEREPHQRNPCQGSLHCIGHVRTEQFVLRIISRILRIADFLTTHYRHVLHVPPNSSPGGCTVTRQRYLVALSADDDADGRAHIQVLAMDI
jgi:hypothetical protein